MASCGVCHLSDAEKANGSVLLRQQTALAKVGELALRSDNLDEILTEACRMVADALGTDLAGVMELGEDGDSLLMRAGVGWDPGVVGSMTLRATNDSSEGQTLRTGEPVVSPDIAGDTRFHYPVFLVDHGIRAVANVIIVGGYSRHPFGVLQIGGREPRHFDDDDIAFLSGYANLLAAAVDRLRVGEDVRDAEKRLRFALEGSQLGSWELHLASGRVTRTPRYDQIFGYAYPPLIWTYDILLDHVLVEDRKLVGTTFRSAVETGTEWHVVFRIRRADGGEVRWVEVRGSLAEGQSGASSTHLLGIVVDITQRKEAEEALLQANEMLEKRVAERTRELVQANDRLRAESEAREQVEEALRQLQRREALAEMNTATEEALRRSNEVLEARVAERTRELVAANDRLRTEAEEREQIEAALRQSHKMEAVGQLTGGIAHDFNNMLASITGSLEMIRTRVGQDRMAEVGRYIEPALASAGRATALTLRLLAFSRRQTLDPKATDVNGLVTGMADLVTRTVGPGIQVETRLDEDLWPVLCDPHQMESALLNLVINSRDAMPEGGRLIIETTNLAHGERRRASREGQLGEQVVLSVTDTGTGMTPEVLAHAFDPFFTTKPLGQGTGLGLSMIHGFVEQSGGHVRLRSQEGRGTTVTIHLPRHFGAVEDSAEEEAAVSPVHAKPSSVVLVVEDEAAVRIIITDTLADHGYTVLEAEDGRSGLDILESNARIDLLLTDVGLPGGMNGRQLADAARQRRPGLKVLFVTGYAEGIAIGNGLLESGMQILTKPFKLDALSTKVHDMTGT